MKITILGSGTYQPELTRHSSSYLLEVGKQKLAFDFGRGALDQLLKKGVNYYNLDAIFISHFHADHSAELIPFLFIALIEPKTGKFRRKDLTIYGPKGIIKALNYVGRAFNFIQYKPKHKIFIKELRDSSRVKGKNWSLESFSVEHSSSLNCLAYRIKSAGRIFCYSGDSSDCPGLRKACRNANLAVIEASWPEKMKPKDHLTGDQTGKIAKECQVKKLILTHIAPYYLKNFDVVKEVKKYYRGQVLLAEDLMTINI